MEIKTIGVVGAGTMGHGIAQVCAQNGYDVILRDVDQGKLDKQVQKIEASFDKFVSKEKMTAEEKDNALKRIQTTTSLAEIGECDLVIEAIFENIQAKLEFIDNLNKVAKDGLIYASNTSSVSITLLASRFKNPENVIGMHFFNPVPLMKLVEVISALQTKPEVEETIYSLAEKLGKSPAKVKDISGFVVNRILVPMINEAIYTLNEGIADAETIDRCMKLGANHPMGPLTLADFVGLDVLLGVLEVYQRDLSPERYKPCVLLRKLVEAGHLGRKTGKGFFDYSK